VLATRTTAPALAIPPARHSPSVIRSSCPLLRPEGLPLRIIGPGPPRGWDLRPTARLRQLNPARAPRPARGSSASHAGPPTNDPQPRQMKAFSLEPSLSTPDRLGLAGPAPLRTRAESGQWPVQQPENRPIPTKRPVVRHRRLRSVVSLGSRLWIGIVSSLEVLPIACNLALAGPRVASLQHDGALDRLTAAYDEAGLIADQPRHQCALPRKPRM
jgi:hypothetical protein